MIVHEIDAEAAEAHARRIEASLAKAVERGKLDAASGTRRWPTSPSRPISPIRPTVNW